MFQRYFAPPEAAKMLPIIKKIVADILSKGRDLKRILQHHSGDDTPLPKKMYQRLNSIWGMLYLA